MTEGPWPVIFKNLISSATNSQSEFFVWFLVHITKVWSFLLPIGCVKMYLSLHHVFGIWKCG